MPVLLCLQINRIWGGLVVLQGRVNLSCPVSLMEALIYSHIAATVAWRDEMQGVTRRQGLFSPGHSPRSAARQFARQAPSRRAYFARYQRGGCGQIGCSLPCTAWCQSPGYDLRRTRRDLPNLTRNAAHGGINQRFLISYRTGFVVMPLKFCVCSIPQENGHNE